MGVSERKLREKSARKNAIIEAAEKIFFSKGIENASMDEVAKEAELSKGTLYLYFKNKNALYRAILRRAYTTLLDHLKAEDYDKLKGFDAVVAICSNYISFSSEYPGYFDAILHYENDVVDTSLKETESVKSIVAGNQVLDELIVQIKKGVADKSIIDQVDPIQTALVLWGQCTGILQMIKSKGLIFKRYFQLEEQQLLDTFFINLKRSLENTH